MYHILLVVHRAHCGVGIVLSREADETEATAAEGITILDNDLDQNVNRLASR